MSKELKTSLHISESGLPDTESLALKVWEWSKSAQPGKWCVKIYQDLTKEQRGYLHAGLIPHYIKIQNDLGVPGVQREDAKADLKKRFLGYKETLFSDKFGNKHETKTLRHTEDLSKEEYAEFIDNVSNWFIDYFGVPAPPPKEEMDRYRK